MGSARIHCTLVRLVLLFAFSIVALQIFATVRFSARFDAANDDAELEPDMRSKSMQGDPVPKPHDRLTLSEPRTPPHDLSHQMLMKPHSREKSYKIVSPRLSNNNNNNPKADDDLHKRTPHHDVTPRNTSDKEETLATDITCDIEWSDAISALNRAKTDECRREIRRITCLAQKNALYALNVERTCPLKAADVGVHEAPHEVPAQSMTVMEDVRIAFVFVVHGRAVRQFRRLFKAVYHKRHFIYIHVDSRSDHLRRKIKDMIVGYPNVAMANWSLSSIWGGASLLQVLLQCLDDLLHKPDWHWDFIINLSETDYPIKSNEELVSFLNKNRDKNFLKPHGGNPMKFIKKQGLDRTFVECENRMWRIGNRNIPKGIEVDGGSDWICLNRDFSEYLVFSKDKLLQAMKTMYMYALLPAESFFHTVLRNGPKCHTFFKNNLRLTNWNRKLGCRCQYKHIVDWCGCSPNDFKPEDLPRLQSSGDRYFARKFEAIVNQEIVNMLDAWLYGPYPSNTSGLHTYFESIYDVEDTLTLPTDSQLSLWMSFMRMSTAHHLSLRQTSAGGGVDSGSNHQNPGFGCLLDPVGMPTEVSVFTERDSFQGLVVTFKVQLPHRGEKVGTRDEPVTVQTWFEMTTTRTTYYRLKGPAGRLTFLEAGSNYDEKERMFRNYGHIIGPYSDVVVACQWTQGVSMNVKFLWYDPNGHLVFTQSATVQTTWVVSFSRPTLKRPLKPGVWKVVAELNSQKMAESVFLVHPVSVKNGREITDSAIAAEVNSDLRRVINERDRVLGRDAADEKKNMFDGETFRQDNEVKIGRTGEELHRWIDSLVAGYWKLRGFCSLESVDECHSIPVCRNEKWSIYHPDPKSELGNINDRGRLR